MQLTINLFNIIGCFTAVFYICMCNRSESFYREFRRPILLLFAANACFMFNAFHGMVFHTPGWFLKIGTLLTWIATLIVIRKFTYIFYNKY